MPCGYCELRCRLENGESVCGSYVYDGKQVVEAAPFHFLEPYCVDMENLPFFHAEPGAQVIQTGTKGCNAKCDYCVNSHLAIEDSDYSLVEYAPGQLVTIAKQQMAIGIVFALNEVTLALPSVVEVSKCAREAGLMTGCLTNGFLTEESAALLAANMDMINVSLKSMSDDFYKKSLSLPSVGPVLRNIANFRKSAHVEIVTPVAKELTVDELHEMADFIESVDPDIPWHIFRLFRTHERSNEEARDFSEMISFTEAIRARLPYTYFSNFPGSKWVDTVCPGCGCRVVRRISIGACGARYFKDALAQKDCCPECSTPIPVFRKEV